MAERLMWAEMKEMRGEEDEEAETWWRAPGVDSFSDFDRRTVAIVPHWEPEEWGKETDQERERNIPGGERET